MPVAGTPAWVAALAIVVMLVPRVPAGAAGAAGAPSAQVAVEADEIVYTATLADSSEPGFKAHLNFPYMKKLGDGTLFVSYAVGQTHGPGRFGQQSFSFDGGQTWEHRTANLDPRQIHLSRPPGQLSRAWSIGIQSSDPAVGFSTWANSRWESMDGGNSWTLLLAHFDANGLSYQSVFGNFNDPVELPGGALLLTCGAMRVGQDVFQLDLYASVDGGANWTRRSTIATHDPGPAVPMGSEGPSEAGMVLLTNGDLLAVFRTGQPFPTNNANAVDPSLFACISTDLGFTWSAPRMLGVAGVWPNLHRLTSGHVMLTYGRYGSKLLFADPTGRRWSHPVVLHNGPSSGHTDMRRLDNGKWLLGYDQSGFYPPSWDPGPPGYVFMNDTLAHLRVMTLDIQVRQASEDYNWRRVYHGDRRPDMVEVPWQRTASGNVSEFLWAELGQDYLRIDTGSSGVPRILYYTLSGAADSRWEAMDFSRGFVLDLRARVSASTLENAANVRMSDGQTGLITLKLVGLNDGSVVLEGTNGVLGQVAYRAVDHPGFTTRDWHRYRLIIGPDEAAGGAVRAKLFLNDDLDEPILMQSLAPPDADEIRFGDVTGVNNGRFDIDFLRFGKSVPPYIGDFDGDGDVDQEDFGLLQACLSGPSVPQNNPPCAEARLDGDADVDQDDVTMFLNCLSGADVTPGPQCRK